MIKKKKKYRHDRPSGRSLSYNIKKALYAIFVCVWWGGGGKHQLPFLFTKYTENDENIIINNVFNFCFFSLLN